MLCQPSAHDTQNDKSCAEWLNSAIQNDKPCADGIHVHSKINTIGTFGSRGMDDGGTTTLE